MSNATKNAPATISAAEVEALRRQLAEAQAKAEQAEQAAQARISVKIADSGAVSVYGLQRFPVSLHASQWQRLAPVVPKVLETITANRDLIEKRAAAHRAAKDAAKANA